MGSAMTLGFLDRSRFLKPINLEGENWANVPFWFSLEIWEKILEWKNNLFLISGCLFFFSFILIRRNFHSTKMIAIDRFERLKLKF